MSVGNNDATHEDAVQTLAGFMAEAVAGGRRDTETFEGARRMAEVFLRDNHVGSTIAQRQSVIRASAAMTHVEEEIAQATVKDDDDDDGAGNVIAFPAHRVVRLT